MFGVLSSGLPGAPLAFGALQSSMKPDIFVHPVTLRKAIYTHTAPLLLPILHPHQPLQPHPPPLPTIQLRPDIQIKRQPAPPAPIKINHILHPRPPTPLHHPIVPVERPLIPPQPQPPRPRTHPAAVPAKTPQLGPPAPLILLSGEPPFPALDLGPGALVDGVVDRHDGRHVRGVGSVVLAPHGVEEHLLGRVDPVR